MKKLYIFSAVLLVVAAACSQENVPAADESQAQSQEVQPVDEPVKVTYIEAYFDDGTKASIGGGGGAFSWSVGDKIAVYTADGYKMSDALEAAASSATFSFSGSNAFEDAGRTDLAVFPASMVFDGESVRSGSASNHTTSSLTITLPASYTLAQAQDNETPRPMIATNTPGSGLAFKSICALVRVTVNNLPKDTYSLKVSFPGKKVQGDFTLGDLTVGTSGVVTASTAGEDDTVTITDLGISEFTTSLVVNVPVPMGVASSQEYLYVRVGAYDSTNHKINSIDTPIKVEESVPTAWAPGRTAGKKVTATLPYFLTNDKTKKKIVFAPGNLQGTITAKPTSDSDKYGAAGSWRFASHQYDALGDCSGNKFGAVGQDLDLFSWIGASATYDYESAPDSKWGVIWPNNSADAEAVGSTHPEKIKYSWAELFNGVTYPAGTWRLPNGDKEGGDSSTEWQRLVYARTTTSGYVVAKATIKNGEDLVARGLIVFPDTYTHPYGVKALVNYGRADSAAGHYADNEITLAEWDILENVGGCAFLPVTSNRIRSGGANTSTNISDAAYWADYSTNTTQGCIMVASDADVSAKSLNGNSSTTISVAKSCLRKNGCAVRLIRDVN